MSKIIKTLDNLGKKLMSYGSLYDHQGIPYNSEGFYAPLWGDFQFGRFGSKKAIKKGYMINDDVYSIISKAARTISNHIEWELYEVFSDGNEEEVSGTDLNVLLKKPNSYQTQQEWRELFYIYMMATGRSFIGKLTGAVMKDNITLYHLPSQITKFESGSLRQPYKKFIVDWEYQNEWMPEDVLFSKYPSIDDKSYFDGLSPLTPGSRLLESSNNLVTADAASLHNRGASNLITNRGEDVMTPEELEETQKAIQNIVGGAEKFNRMAVTSANVDILPIGLSPSDLKLIESDISKRRRFANIFQIDSSLLNDPANKTYNNVKEAVKAAFLDVYIPLDRKFVEGLNMWLTPMFDTGRNSVYQIRHKYDQINVLQEDKQKEASIAEKKSLRVKEVLIAYGNQEISRGGAMAILTKIFMFSEEDANSML